MAGVPRRAAAFLLAAVFCLFALSSCGKAQGVERTGGKTVLSAGGYDVGEVEYNYYYLNHKENDGMTDEEAADAAEYDAVRNIAVLAMAKDYGIELNDAEREYVKTEMESIEDALTPEVFADQLDSFHMTRELYLYLSQIARLESDLREYILDERSGVLKYDDAAVLDDIRENFIAVKQILIPASGDDAADRKKAEEALNALTASGASGFDGVAEEYGKDEQADPAYGRYFTHGMYPAAFEEAAKALKVGEISDIVETEVGYHIIMRAAMDDGYINDNFEQLRYYFLTRCFNEMLEEKQSSLEVKRK